MESFTIEDTTIRWHGHSTVSLSLPGTRVYVDPYRLHGRWPDATHILITHPHHDHLDPSSIQKLDSGETRLFCPRSVSVDEIPLPAQRIRRLAPGHSLEFKERPVTISAHPAYNPDRTFHPESRGWLGFSVETAAARIYHAGDTGPVPVRLDEPVDLGLLPVDGIYTMSAREAATWAEQLELRAAAPIHYGTERGSITDALKFRRSLGQTESVHLEESRLRV